MDYQDFSLRSLYTSNLIICNNFLCCKTLPTLKTKCLTRGVYESSGGLGVLFLGGVAIQHLHYFYFVSIAKSNIDFSIIYLYNVVLLVVHDIEQCLLLHLQKLTDMIPELYYEILKEGQVLFFGVKSAK